ncbi:MAG: DnaJ domain-containing protein [Deltaproteobacteria bacterium]|nr:DnaJ domain-containing protein [Deltaproteobacteria bacterium]
MEKPEQYAEILGVRPNASGKEIKKAYRDLRRAWQPKRFPNQLQRQREAEEKLRKITEAYQELQALRRQARQQAAQSEDCAKPASTQSAQTPEIMDPADQLAQTPEIMDATDQQAPPPSTQSAQTPEIMDAADQQAPPPQARPAPADRQLAKLPKPKEPFVPIPLPEKPAPGRSVFLVLSVIAALIILLLIFTQLYEQTKTVVSSSQNTPLATFPSSPPSLEDLMATPDPSDSALSAPQPTAESAAKSRTPTGYGLNPGPGSTSKRSSEARNTTEHSESAKGRSSINKRTSAGPVTVEEQPLQPSQ